MDTITDILAQIFGIGFIIFGIVFGIGLWSYMSDVLDHKKPNDDKKSTDDDD